MNEPEHELSIAHERTEQARIMGWAAGLTGMGAVHALASHPTWPCLIGVVAVVGLFAAAARVIFPAHLQELWRTRPMLLRKIIRSVLLLLILLGWLVALRFEYHDERNDVRQSMRLDIGAYDPWFHWEKTTEQTTAPGKTATSYHSGSHVQVVSWSFGAVILAVLCQVVRTYSRHWDSHARSGSQTGAG